MSSSCTASGSSPFALICESRTRAWASTEKAAPDDAVHLLRCGHARTAGQHSEEVRRSTDLQQGSAERVARRFTSPDRTCASDSPPDRNPMINASDAPIRTLRSQRRTAWRYLRNEKVRGCFDDAQRAPCWTVCEVANNDLRLREPLRQLVCALIRARQQPKVLTAVVVDGCDGSTDSRTRTSRVPTW